MWEILAFAAVTLILSGVLACLFRISEVVDLNDVVLDDDEELRL